MLALALGMVATQAAAWGNHSLATYRALEKMPEVALASTVNAETLDSFLKAEEKTLEALLASHEAWAASNLDRYSARPAVLAFIADAARSEDSRRLAFLMALRVAPTSKFALASTTDPWATSPYAAPHTQALADGDAVSALSVIATATDEPALGLDTHIWDDSASDWGRIYGLGPAPDGNTAPLAAHPAPSANRILVPLRVYQFSTLASLAFRTGHPYWGWRFAGISLHYVQNLTQPYYASLSPSDSSLRLLTLYALAKLGWDGPRNNQMALRTNQSSVLDKYQSELMQTTASAKQEGPLEKALRSTDKDRSYPDWSAKYLRDTVVPQAQAQSAQTARLLLDAMPAQYVSNPEFDFASRESVIHLCQELKSANPDKRARLDGTLAELLANFGAHSRNALRAILRASTQL